MKTDSYHTILGLIFNMLSAITAICMMIPIFMDTSTKRTRRMRAVVSIAAFIFMLIPGTVFIFLPEILEHLRKVSKNNLIDFFSRNADAILISISIFVILFSIWRLFRIRNKFYGEYIRTRRGK